MEALKISKVFSRLLIALLIIVTLPAWSFFGGDKVSSDTRDILKSHFPYRNVVNHLLSGNPDDIQGSFPNLNLEYVQGGERSGAKQELYRSTGRPVMLISQMIARGRVIFVAAAKRQNDIPVRKLIKASHDSKTHTVRGQKIESYFLGYGKEQGTKVRHIMEIEFNQGLNMKLVNWKLVIDK